MCVRVLGGEVVWIYQHLEGLWHQEVTMVAWWPQRCTTHISLLEKLPQWTQLDNSFQLLHLRTCCDICTQSFLFPGCLWEMAEHSGDTGSGPHLPNMGLPQAAFAWASPSAWRGLSQSCPEPGTPLQRAFLLPLPLPPLTLPWGSDQSSHPLLLPFCFILQRCFSEHQGPRGSSTTQRALAGRCAWWDVLPTGGWNHSQQHLQVQHSGGSRASSWEA